MVKVPAPVESVEIIVAESFPPQYFALVVSRIAQRLRGIPWLRRVPLRQCHHHSRDQPGARAVGAGRLRRRLLTHEFSVPLGTDFQPGETYTVAANEVVETFVGQ